MYGAQALKDQRTLHDAFENDVEMYGAQAARQKLIQCRKFENDVEMYGAQATGWLRADP